MSDFMNNYFGPLDKKDCMFFYILSIIFALFFLITIVTVIRSGITRYNKKTLNFTFVFSSLYILVATYFTYFEFRLLNTMCVNSVL